MGCYTSTRVLAEIRLGFWVRVQSHWLDALALKFEFPSFSTSAQKCCTSSFVPEGLTRVGVWVVSEECVPGNPGFPWSSLIGAGVKAPWLAPLHWNLFWFYKSPLFPPHLPLGSSSPTLLSSLLFSTSSIALLTLS